MKKNHAIVSGAAFSILILLVFTALVLLTGRVESQPCDVSPGYADLSGFDFSRKLVRIDNSGFLYFKEAFYTPENFKLDSVKTEPVALNDGRVDPGSYGTYRITVTLPAAGETYGISSQSAMYAQRLFINGREYPPVGVTGETAQTSVPKVEHYTVYFTPETERTEIVIQFSNFCHYDNGGIVSLYLGTQQLIVARDASAQQRTHVFFGCAMTAFLLSIGMFLFFRRRYSFLWFAFACLSAGLRMLLVEEKSIMLLFPNMPWESAIGLEYIVLIALLLSFLLYINSVFTGSLHKHVIIAYSAVCAIYSAVVLITPPIVFTRFVLAFQICSAVFGVYVLAALICNLVRKSENRHRERYLILSGALAFVVLSILDIQLYRSNSNSFPIGLSEVGMMFLIFVNMIALTLGFARTETELDRARCNEQEAQQTNLMLYRMGRLKSEFLANISHEMRTPLTVMANYAGLTSLEIRKGAVSEKTLENLQVVKREAIRLADMVEQLKTVSLERERELTLAEVSAFSLLQRAADFCGAICSRNGNSVEVYSDADDIVLRVNPDSIFQVFVNLIINANRHTKRGSIRLSVRLKPENAFATASVCDDGDGIERERLYNVFERGVSDDGSSGLGLPICKEIIEEHGGSIWIESDKGKGTEVLFTLPVIRGGAKYDE